MHGDLCHISRSTFPEPETVRSACRQPGDLDPEAGREHRPASGLPLAGAAPLVPARFSMTGKWKRKRSGEVLSTPSGESTR